MAEHIDDRVEWSLMTSAEYGCADESWLSSNAGYQTAGLPLREEWGKVAGIESTRSNLEFNWLESLYRVQGERSRVR